MKSVGAYIDLVYGSNTHVESGGEQKMEGMRDARVRKFVSGSVLCCVKEYEYVYEH
jgi:hypothetical protein